ncbi:MAG: hypothetical protein ACRDFB_08900 [Rhabdochlamydiaceae bacterium]
MNSQEFCANAVKQLYGLSQYMFKQYARHFNKKTVPVHRNLGNSYSQERTDIMTNWLTNFVNLVGEPQPNTSFINLPSYLNKAQLYEDATAELKLSDPHYNISSSQFYNIWSTSFKHVKIPIQTRLGRCDECSSINKDFDNLHDEEEIAQWKSRKNSHLNLVKEERSFLQQRKFTARTNPQTYHHLIIDGMTMIYMPNIQPIPKGMFTSFFCF